MGGKWVQRWDPAPDGAAGSLLPCLRVQGTRSIGGINWVLPFSKSHAIRYLALAALSEQTITFHNMQGSGEDTNSMRRCLMQCGVVFRDMDRHGHPLVPETNGDQLPHPDAASWVVVGVGSNGLKAPGTVLHSGNSGTALRILIGLASRWSTPVMLDGDASLRKRPFGVMIGALNSGGVNVSHGTGPEQLPLLIQGPMSFDQPIQLDATVSSQPVTSWLIASAGASTPARLTLTGTAVSQRHAELTMDLCRSLGASIERNGDGLVVQPWSPVFEHVEIDMPSDASMMAFPLLAALVCNTKVTLANTPAFEDSLGHELLVEYAASLGLTCEGGVWYPSDETSDAVMLNLRDANDLITPLSAMLALGHGGTISGAAHAAHKESNRLEKTLDLLQAYGLHGSVTTEGLVLEGGQQLSLPGSVVRTWDDHRLQMTAIVLAMGVEGEVLIEGDRLHCVADPAAASRWAELGVDVGAHLHQPW